MKTLIVYDSDFGSTKKIAEEMAQELATDTKVYSVNKVNADDLTQAELIIIGSPIHGWRPTQNILWFIYRLNEIGRKHVKAAAFDTRVKSFLSGNGAKIIGKALKDRGFKMIDQPEGFFVKGKEGPLLDGEILRARLWAKQILSQAEKN